MAQVRNITILQKTREEVFKAEEQEDNQEYEGFMTDVKDDLAAYKSFWIGILNSSENKRKSYNSKAKHAIKQSSVKREKFIVHPNSIWKVRWDIIISCLILYSVVLIPYRIGFDKLPDLGEKVFDYIVMSMFFIDIIVSFNCAYHDTEKETYVFKRKVIAMHYMKFWFWVDFFSTIPFDDIIGSFVHASNLGSIRIIRILRLIRLFKLFRLTRVAERLEEWDINPSLVNLVTIVLQIFFISHLFACFWHYLALYEDTHRTWLSVYALQDATVDDRYINSLYYIIVTMLTVGYGDIHPTNTPERVFGIFTMLTGSVIFGALISKVTILIERRNPQAKAFKEKMNEMKSFLDDKALSKPLARKAKEAYKYYLTKKSAFMESQILDELPQTILYDTINALYKDDIKQVQLFTEYNKKNSLFVVDIIRRSRPQQASRHEVIFDDGDICNEIIFVTKGIVKIFTSAGSSDVLTGLCTEKVGYFGDFEYYKNTCSIAKYQAENNCTMLSVPHEVLNRASANNIDEGARFKFELRKRYEALLEVLKHSPVDIPASSSSNNEKSMSSRRRASITGALSVKKRNRYVAPRKKLWVNGDVKPFDESMMMINAIHSGGLGTIVGRIEQTDEITFRVRSEGEYDEIIEEDLTAGELLNRFIFHPKEKYKVYWDLFIGFWIVYSILLLPVELAFNMESTRLGTLIDLLVDACFLFDIILCFRTAYECPTKDAYEITPYKIRYNYLSSWFLIDFFSSIPIEEVFFGVSRSGNGIKSVRLLKIFRLVRLLKLSRILKLSDKFDKLEDFLGIPAAGFDLLKLSIEVFFIAHYVACVWWGLCRIMTKHTWYEQWGGYDMVYENMKYTATVGEQYLASLYFTFTTMTTVGYGDIYGINPSERVVNIVIILLGASVFGYILANVSSLMSGLNEAGTRKSQKIAEITEYLVEKSAPSSIKDRVVGHFKHLYSLNSAFDESEILSKLPHTISHQILLSQYKTKLHFISIFRYIHNDSVKLYIFNLMKPIFFDPNDYIIKQGRESTDILFLTTGKARAFRKKAHSHKPKKMMKKGLSMKNVGGMMMKAPLGILQKSIIKAVSDVTNVLFHSSKKNDGTTEQHQHHLDYHQQQSSSSSSKKTIMPGSKINVEIEMSLQQVQASFKHDIEQANIISNNNSNNALDAIPSIETTKNQLPTLVLRKKSVRVDETKNSTDENDIVTSTVVAITKNNNSSSHDIHYTDNDDNHNNNRIHSDLGVSLSQSHRYYDKVQVVDIDHHYISEGEEKEIEGKANETAANHDAAILNKSNLSASASTKNNVNKSKSIIGEVSSPIMIGGGFNSTSSKKQRNHINKSHSHSHDDNDDVDSFSDTQASSRSMHLPNLVHEVPFNKMTAKDMKKKKWEYVGEISRGDFVGHVGLMYAEPHRVCVRALQPCVIFALSKQEIVRQLKIEPTVAMKLQAALSEAIGTQADVLGRFHKQKHRFEFLKGVRQRYLAKHNLLDNTITKKIRRRIIGLRHALSLKSFFKSKKVLPASTSSDSNKFVNNNNSNNQSNNNNNNNNHESSYYPLTQNKETTVEQQLLSQDDDLDVRVKEVNKYKPTSNNNNNDNDNDNNNNNNKNNKSDKNDKNILEMVASPVVSNKAVVFRSKRESKGKPLEGKLWQDDRLMYDSDDDHEVLQIQLQTIAKRNSLVDKIRAINNVRKWHRLFQCARMHILLRSSAGGGGIVHRDSLLGKIGHRLSSMIFRNSKNKVIEYYSREHLLKIKKLALYDKRSYSTSDLQGLEKTFEASEHKKLNKLKKKVRTRRQSFPSMDNDAWKDKQKFNGAV